MTITESNGTFTFSATDTNTDTHYTNYLQIKGNGTEAVKFTQDSNKTLNLKQGNNVSISAASDEITISATDTNTSHNHNVGIGLVGSGSAGTGGGTYTYKAKLRSETALTVDSAAATTTSGRVYPVAADKSGYLSVNVPWTDTHADISNLVPYTGASKDVDLGNHSLLISDKTVVGGGAKIKISGRFQSEDDTSITIEPGNITLTDPRSNGLKATLAAGKLSITDDTYTGLFNKGGFKAQLREDTNGDGQLDATYYSTYVYDGIVHNGKKLLLPEKDGTIALTNDLSTLLDKGTSSTVVNQVVYNPVEMKKALKVPSIRGENSANNNMNGAPLYSLGSTMATEGGQATGSSSLTLTGYTGATGNPYSTTFTQAASGGFAITPASKFSQQLSFSDKWKIAGSPILTESSISTQQWTLTSTSGTVTTVNICTK